MCPYKKIYCHVKFHTVIESGAHFVLFENLYCFVTDYRCADVLHVHLCVC